MIELTRCDTYPELMSRRERKAAEQKALEQWLAENPDPDKFTQRAALFRDGVDMAKKGHDAAANDLLHRAGELGGHEQGR